MFELSLTSGVKSIEEMYEGENNAYSFVINFEEIGGAYTYYNDKKIALLYKLPSGRVRVQEESISLTVGSMNLPMANYLLAEGGVLSVQVVVFTAEDPETHDELTIFDMIEKFNEWNDPGSDDPQDQSEYVILKSKVYEFYINNSVDPTATLIDSHSGGSYPDIIQYLSRYFAKNSELSRVAFTGDYNDLSNRPSGGGGETITVDNDLSGTSTNPVQNKVIKTALDEKADMQYTRVFKLDQPISSFENNNIFKTPVTGGSRYPLAGYLVSSGTPSVYSQNMQRYLQLGSKFKLSYGSYELPLITVAEVINYGTVNETWYYFVATPNITRISFDPSQTVGMTWEVPNDSEPAFVMRINPDSTWIIATRLINLASIGTSAVISAKEKYVSLVGNVSIAVDSTINGTSENPVQNKVIKAALNEKADKQYATLLYSSTANFEAVSSGSGSLYDETETLLSPQYCDVTNTQATADLLTALSAGKTIKLGQYPLTVSEYTSNSQVAGYFLMCNAELFDAVNVHFKRIDSTAPMFVLQVVAANNDVYAFSTVSGEYELQIFGEGSPTVQVDSALNSSSTNPVQNNVISTALDAKSDVGHTHNTSKLFNDERFISNPRTVRFSFTAGAGQQMPSGYVGGTDAYMYFGEISASNAADVLAAAQLQVPVYANGLPMTPDYDNGEAVLVYNLKTTETGSTSGFDIDDPTKPSLVISVGTEDDPQITSGYTVTVFYTEPFTSLDVTGYTEGSYLTSHQSLSNYYTKSEVDSAIATAISGAIGGSY